MSKNINVNPDHYKVGGRERQGEEIAQKVQRQQLKEKNAAHRREAARRKEQS